MTTIYHPTKNATFATKRYAMDKSFKIMMQHRKVLYHYLKDVPLEVLNTIPSGFRNNIIWNIGHTIVTQQLLVYRLSGLSTLVSDKLIDRYRKGTVPDGKATTEEVETLEKLLFSTVEKTIADYQLGVFREFSLFTTMNKVTLANVDDAILFNNFHEGLHQGYIMALQKALSR